MGFVVPAATVIFTSDTTKEVHLTKTNANGNYALVAVQPSVYSLRVEQQGFKVAERTNVKFLQTIESAWAISDSKSALSSHRARDAGSDSLRILMGSAWSSERDNLGHFGFDHINQFFHCVGTLFEKGDFVGAKL